MKKTTAIIIVACISIALCACSSEDSTENLDLSEGSVTARKDLDSLEETGTTQDVPADWQSAYLEIICNMPSVVRINGKESTLEEMNRIYTTDYAQRESEEHRERIRLVNEDGVWVLKFQSGEEAILDEQFDYSLIIWE